MKKRNKNNSSNNNKNMKLSNLPINNNVFRCFTCFTITMMMIVRVSSFKSPTSTATAIPTLHLNLCTSTSLTLFTTHQCHNNNHHYYYQQKSTTTTSTKLQGVASRIYDMDAITESTTDFRDQFASFADEDDNDEKDIDIDDYNVDDVDDDDNVLYHKNKRKKRISSSQTRYVDKNNQKEKEEQQQKNIMYTVSSSTSATSTKPKRRKKRISPSHTTSSTTSASSSSDTTTIHEQYLYHNQHSKHLHHSHSSHHTHHQEKEPNDHNNANNHGHDRGHSTTIRRGLGLHLSYESAIQVLRIYHSIHGHLVIPRRYTIPSSSIPTTTTTKPSSSSHLKNTPTTNNISYPKQWHNLDIASTVYNMNWWTLHIKSNPDRVKELNSLGFVWERLQPEWNLVLEAMVIYKEIYGHVKVPASFVVPYGHDGSDDGSDDDGNDNNVESNSKTHKSISSSTSVWPKATWGIPLGNCVHRIRTRGDFLRNDEVAWSRRRQLDGLGFIWDVQEYSFERFFMALKIFSKVEESTQHSRNSSSRSGGSGSRSGITSSSGTRSRNSSGRSKALRIPRSFVIPSSPTFENNNGITITNPWPKELWGYPLGVKSAAIRQKGLYIKNNPERQRALQEIGFQMSGNNTIGWLNIVWASAIYSKIHGKGKLDVPIHFVVPSPPSSSSSKMTSSSMLSTHGRNEIDYGTVGVCNLRNTDLDFNAVDESWPWPEQLWGFPLGQRLKDVRVKGAHLKSEKSAKARRAQLDALGFVWEPKRGRRKRSLGG